MTSIAGVEYVQPTHQLEFNRLLRSCSAALLPMCTYMLLARQSITHTQQLTRITDTGSLVVDSVKLLVSPGCADTGDRTIPAGMEPSCS